MKVYLQELIRVVCEAIVYQIIISATFIPRKEDHRTLYSAYLVALICCSNLLCLIYIHNSIVKCFIVINVNVIISYMFYYSNILIRINTITFSYSLFIAVDALTMIIIPNLNAILETPYISLEIFLNYLTIFSRILIIVLTAKMKRNMLINRILNIESKFALFCAFSFMGLNIINAILLSRNPSENTIMIIILTFSMGVMYLFLYALSKIVSSQAKTLHENAILKQQIEFQSERIITLTELVMQHKKFMHDYRNQITTIKQLSLARRYDRVEKFVSALSESLIVGYCEFHTNNEIIDAILNFKMAKAKKAEIEFCVTYNNLSKILLADDDIVCLLTNLLDNAIEACEKAPFAHKKILVKIEHMCGKTLLSVKNTISKKPKLVCGKFITSKEIFNAHGIGSVIIGSTLDKYNATHEIFIDEDWFQIVIIIPEKFIKFYQD